jgi:THO complex subunit 3
MFLAVFRYFATGGADALTCLWDVADLVCIRTFARLDWPVRTLSFSFDDQIIATASEDLYIDLAYTTTGEKISQISTQASTFTVAWHPNKHLLAYACEDKDHKHDRDTGAIWLFGLPNA